MDGSKKVNVFFSVVLATHNEEKNLKRCLLAISDIADEVIIVDGESSDNTLDIAKSFGALIIKTTNKLNFHINKQIAIDRAKGTLVLQLDADEVVDDVLKTELKKLISDLSTHPDLTNHQPKAWSIPRKNWYLGRFLTKGGQYPDRVIRLFIRGFAHLPQKNVHEQLVVNGQVETLRGHLNHYGHPDFATSIVKLNTYTSFEAERLFKLKSALSISAFLSSFTLKPLTIFFSLYLRHRGYVDGFSGFVFATMSALHPPITYLKLWELYELGRS